MIEKTRPIFLSMAEGQPRHTNLLHKDRLTQRLVRCKGQQVDSPRLSDVWIHMQYISILSMYIYIYIHMICAFIYLYIHYITLHCIALHCIALHYFTLHYITLHYHTIPYHTYIHMCIYIYTERERERLGICSTYVYNIFILIHVYTISYDPPVVRRTPLIFFGEDYLGWGS